jgi:hypothetical protein
MSPTLQPQAKWPCKIRRLIDLHPSSHPPQNNPKLRDNDPFKLIPIVSKTAKTFELEHKHNETITSNTITHTDDLSAWLYGVKIDSIKNRYQVVPDDMKIAAF